MARLLMLAGIVTFALSTQVVFAQTKLSSTEQRIVAAAAAEDGRAIQLLETLVNINSGTMNLEGVRKVGDIMRSQLEPLGFKVRWVPMDAVKRAGHLVAEHKGSGRGKRLLFIGHMDTVFEKDSPFQRYERQGDKAVGPGVNDMKDGLAIMVSALRAMKTAGTLKDATVMIVLSGDEDYTSADVPVRAIRGVTLTVQRGEFVAIMGASGSGKSTLMNILGCLDTPTSGKYLLDGDDVSTLDRDELADLRNLKLGFVFQGFNLLSRTTALENVELPLICGARRRKVKNVRDLAMQRLAQVGLAERAEHFPNQLSGGQQQRVAIARALVNEPEVVLADEPTGNLDSKTSLEIVNIFQELNEAGLTVIMVTHELYMARFCKRILVVRDGLLVRDDPVADRLRAPEELLVVKREEEAAKLLAAS